MSSMSFGEGDDTVGNPHRAQIYEFEFFELVHLFKIEKQFPVEQFDAAVTRSTVPSLPFSREIHQVSMTKCCQKTVNINKSSQGWDCHGDRRMVWEETCILKISEHVVGNLRQLMRRDMSSMSRDSLGLNNRALSEDSRGPSRAFVCIYYMIMCVCVYIYI